MTNEEFISDLMTRGPGGVLQQVFVVEAVRKYAEQVLAADPDLFNNGVIAGPSWIRMAEYVTEKMTENYGSV